jgi:methionyl-tRNA synthetase
MSDKILITSALLYANGPLHFGHMAGAYLPADIYARFNRLLGKDVLFISGSDEYGIAITLSAQLAGKTPQEHVEFYHHLNKSLFDQLEISFDHYSRTTWSEHGPIAQDFFKVLLEKNLVEEKETDQLYSEQENQFLADRYVMGNCPKCDFEEARGDECPKCAGSFDSIDLKNPVSKLSKKPLIKKRTKHWFLRLDLFKEDLLKWIKAKDWKPNVVNFITKYIEDLRPRAITRDMKWGIPVPVEGADGKVLYVWFDAPIGYISATKQWAIQKNSPDLWKDYWLDPKTKLVQFIGKDNIPFHSVIFPAMVMGQDTPYKLVDELPANEFLNLEGKQFSKSDGWYIDLQDMLTRYDVDQIRYTLAANAPENSDSEFTWMDFYNRCNGELLGKLGNFVNRSLVFMKNNFSSKVPQYVLSDTDQEFLVKIKELVFQAKDSYLKFNVRKVCQILMEIAQQGNVFFDHKQPWKLVKDPSKHQELLSVMGVCLEVIKSLCVVAYPIIPTSSQKIWGLLGYTEALQNYSFEEIVEMQVPHDRKLPEPFVLFKKLEKKQIEQEVQDLKDRHQAIVRKKKQQEKPPLEEITFEDFKKVQLKVGKVIAAEEVKKSKKLLKLTVSLGEEQRTIVSGIKENYTAEEILGKSVVVVANLKPAKLMGIESQGMILAAGDKDGLELVTVCETPAGVEVS